MLGTLAGHVILSILVMRGKPQAGLPFLNSGAILGFFAGVLLSGSINSVKKEKEGLTLLTSFIFIKFLFPPVFFLFHKDFFIL
jgi:hypothetical protein